jgi:hypothetical protein
LKRARPFFTADQLNTMAESGTWIVTQTIGGAVTTRDARTTDTTTLSTSTEMYSRNVDSISYFLRSRLEPYLGRANVVTSALEQMRIDLVSAIEFLKTRGFTTFLGGQIIDADIVELRQSLLQADRITVVIRLELPFPIKTIEVYLMA